MGKVPPAMGTRGRDTCNHPENSCRETQTTCFLQDIAKVWTFRHVQRVRTQIAGLPARVSLLPGTFCNAKHSENTEAEEVSIQPSERVKLRAESCCKKDERPEQDPLLTPRGSCRCAAGRSLAEHLRAAGTRCGMNCLYGSSCCCCISTCRWALDKTFQCLS